MRAKEEIIADVKADLKKYRGNSDARQEVLVAALFEVWCDLRDAVLLVLGLAESGDEVEEKTNADDRIAGQ